jgi:hypothetical protein
VVTVSVALTSLTSPVTTLTIDRATVYVSGAAVETAKFADGTTTAVVTNAGTLNNVQGSDRVQHTTTAAYNTATVGDNKTITVTYALNGAAALLDIFIGLSKHHDEIGGQIENRGR